MGRPVGAEDCFAAHAHLVLFPCNLPPVVHPRASDLASQTRAPQDRRAKKGCTHTSTYVHTYVCMYRAFFLSTLRYIVRERCVLVSM